MDHNEPLTTGDMEEEMLEDEEYEEAAKRKEEIDARKSYVLINGDLMAYGITLEGEFFVIIYKDKTRKVFCFKTNDLRLLTKLRNRLNGFLDDGRRDGYA
jgi:hypothetical protein